MDRILGKRSTSSQYIYWTATAFAIILSTGILIRLAENDCFLPYSAHCNDVVGERFKQFVKFTWIPDHQDFMGGMLAFFAGSFVYFTARRQRQDAINDRLQETTASRRARLSLCYEKLGVAISLWNLAENRQEKIDALSKVLEQTTSIHDFAPRIAVYISAAASACMHHIEDINAVFFIFAPFTYLKKSQRLIDDSGTFRLSKVPIKALTDQIGIERVAWIRRDYEFFDDMFDESPSSPASPVSPPSAA